MCKMLPSAWHPKALREGWLLQCSKAVVEDRRRLNELQVLFEQGEDTVLRETTATQLILKATLILASP